MEAGGFEPPDSRFCKSLPHKKLRPKPCRHRHLRSSQLFVTVAQDSLCFALKYSRFNPAEDAPGESSTVFEDAGNRLGELLRDDR
jgi:hypothetical protein